MKFIEELFYSFNISPFFFVALVFFLVEKWFIKRFPPQNEHHEFQKKMRKALMLIFFIAGIIDQIKIFISFFVK